MTPVDTKIHVMKISEDRRTLFDNNSFFHAKRIYLNAFTGSDTMHFTIKQT